MTRLAASGFGSGRPLVLVAEDDADFRELICSQLSRDELNLLPVKDGAAAMEYIDLAFMEPLAVPVPKLLVTDVRMPRRSGLDLVTYASFIPTIVLTAFPSATLRAEARRLGARYLFEKPFELEDLRLAVRRLIDGSG